MIYIFNPEHDQALANFSSNYTPPASTIRMADDLAVLPVWYSTDENVIAEGKLNHDYINSIKKIIPLSSKLIPYNDIALCKNEEIIPWGWNPVLRKRLLSHGATDSQLPSIEYLQTLRNYSNRINAVHLLKELKYENSNLYGESHFFSEINSLLSYLQHTPGNKILKMPISGSGKGLIWILDGITDKQTDWCKRVIKNQGGVVAEPVLDKMVDFAMEFYLNNGVADFFSYSIFNSTPSGAYVGNELKSDERIENKLAEYVPLNLIHKLRKSLPDKLTTLFPEYKGYAGVDMMICRTNEGFRIQPCIEINMRMNMGVVARLFYNRYIDHGSKGMFVVDYFKKSENIVKFNKKNQRELPLKIKNGKIISGYLSLTPVTSNTHYIVYVMVSKLSV